MGSQALFLVVLFSSPFMSMGNVGPPVFLFRDARVESSIAKPLAGHTILKDEFSALVAGIKNSDLLITFLQDELSNEDFLRLDQNMKRGGLFKNVQKYSEMKTSTYFPSVKTPEESLADLMETYNEEVEVKDPMEAVKYLSDTKPEKDTSILIHLVPTAVEESSAALRKNDEIIGEVMRLIEQSGLSYVAFFTASSHRKAHEAAVVQGVGRHLLTAGGNSSQFFHNDTNCLIYIDSMSVQGALVTEEPVITCLNASERGESNDTNIMYVTVAAVDQVSIEMTFTKDIRKIWQLTNTTVGSKQVIVPDVSAPFQFSYHCSTGLSFYELNETTGKLIEPAALSLKTIQVQVFDFKEDNQFGYPYDCVGFFTIPLWTGLLTSLFLIVVTVYGLYMLSSVQTFDQYDDPKGKPLTVTVSE